MGKQDNDVAEQPREKVDLEALSDKELMESVVPALLMRKYHLPNYGWAQDLKQYLMNNHPIFGIFCHHPLHPVKTWIRVVALIGSIMFGLAITNMIYLAFVFTDQDYDQSYVAVPQNGVTSRNEYVEGSVSELTLSNGNIALWTLGGVLHAMYDNVIWALAAWNWNGDLKGRLASYQSMTRNVLVILCVLVAVAMSTLAGCIRAALDRDGVDRSAVKSGGLADDAVELFEIDTANDFEFMIAYLVEIILTMFVWYFVIGFVLFTGVLGCGKIPVLGGRPFDLLTEERERQALEGSST